MPRILLPAGMFNGCSSSYSICQLKSNLGTSRIVCSRPSGYTITQRKLLPRRCMCGDIAYSVMSSVTGVIPVSDQSSAYGGMFGVLLRRRVAATREPFAAIRCGIARRRDQPAVLVDVRAFRNVDDEHAQVMDDGAIARTDFERLGESIFSERYLRVKHLDAKLALGRNRELNRHPEHLVRLAAGGPPFRGLGLRLY